MPPQGRAISPPRSGAAKQKGSARTTGEGSDQKNGGGASKKLSADEQRDTQKLQQADREVRAHEAAHVAAGGRYIRKAASYNYQTGPDGKRYAVGGEVSIDVSEESTPSATIQKMKIVRAAALAPSQPSSKDYAVANKATQNSSEARMEKAQEESDMTKASSGEKSAAPAEEVKHDFQTGMMVNISA
jgi:SprA-related family